MIFAVVVGYVLIGAFVTCAADEISGCPYDFPFVAVWALWPLVVVGVILAGIAAVPVLAGNKFGEWISTLISKRRAGK